MERESIEMDVLFVGAGPACLSGALHLARLVSEHNEAVERGSRKGKSLGEVQIAVIEKGASVGAHILSGAVMDPKALAELVPDFLERGAPVESEVKEDYFLYLTKTRAIKSPVTPPPLKNHGYYIVSLNKLTAWLGEKCEEAGVNIFPEFPGAEVLYDGQDRVVGVRTGDKELWELPDDRCPLRRVTHTLGFPSDADTYGGGWIYGMQNRVVNLGYVTGLDYRDPLLDPHAEFQRFKQHPFVAKLLEGGKLLRYGAKTIAAGGYYAMPQLYADGVLLVGDCAGFLNPQRIKGIHTAIKSGMLAAEAIFAALLADDYAAQQLSLYERLVKESWVM